MSVICCVRSLCQVSRKKLVQPDKTGFTERAKDTGLQVCVCVCVRHCRESKFILTCWCPWKPFALPGLVQTETLTKLSSFWSTDMFADESEADLRCLEHCWSRGFQQTAPIVSSIVLEPGKEAKKWGSRIWSSCSAALVSDDERCLQHASFNLLEFVRLLRGSGPCLSWKVKYDSDHNPIPALLWVWRIFRNAIWYLILIPQPCSSQKCVFFSSCWWL